MYCWNMYNILFSTFKCNTNDFFHLQSRKWCECMIVFVVYDQCHSIFCIWKLSINPFAFDSLVLLYMYKFFFILVVHWFGITHFILKFCRTNERRQHTTKRWRTTTKKRMLTELRKWAPIPIGPHCQKCQYTRIVICAEEFICISCAMIVSFSL